MPSQTTTPRLPSPRASAAGASIRTPLQWAGVIAASVTIAMVVAFGWQWWQEKPLRDAEAELARGNAPRGLALAEYFLDLHPGSSRAEVARARALAMLGRADEALAIYERFGAATPDDLQAWARSHLLREQWSRAAPLLEQVLRIRPNDPDALYELSSCRTRLGLLADARETAEKYAALPGLRARGDLLLAAIHADSGATDEAILAFSRAATLAPDGLDLHLPPEEFFLQYGTLLLNQGRGDEAVALFEKSLAARPTAAAHHLLGKAYARAGDSDAARRNWTAAIELDPAGVSPREDLANLALSAGDPAAAREWLGPLTELAEGRSESAYLFQRLAALEKDDAAFEQWKEKTDALRAKEKLIRSMEKMMAGAPTSYWAQVVRAHKFATLGNWPQAADMINGIERTPDEDAFVSELREAVRTRGPLPALDRVPLKQF